MKKLILIPALMLAIAFSFTACKTTKLEPSGAYAPTNAVGQVIYNDVGLALADASYKFAYDTALTVFGLERDNRATFWAISPNIKHELDKLRPQVVKVNLDWAKARKLYKANPTPAGLTTVQTILAEMLRLLPVIQSQLAPVNNAVTK